MAHQGGVVTQSLTQISERGNLNNLDDAAHIARIWLNMPNNNNSSDRPRPIHLPVRNRAAADGKKEETPAEQPDQQEGPTSEEHHGRLPAADQTRTVIPADQDLAAADDRNVMAYSQLQSPLFGKLPAELRVQVWEHALTPAARIDRPTVAVGVLETCRRAYDETKLLLYRRNQVRAHLLKSPLPGNKQQQQHWTRLLSPAQQAATHLNLYVQPATSNAYGWNLLRWTKQLDFHPGTLQLTIWFTSSIGWWNYYVKDIFKNLGSMRGIKRCVLEFRTVRDRFLEFDKHIQELREKDIRLVDGSTLVWDGHAPEYWEGSRVIMDNAFGRPTHLPEAEQPRWIPCQDPEQAAKREMLAIVVKWKSVVVDGPS